MTHLLVVVGIGLNTKTVVEFGVHTFDKLQHVTFEKFHRSNSKIAQAIAENFWRRKRLLNSITEFENILPQFLEDYNNLLLWKNLHVELYDKKGLGKTITSGILVGLNNGGNLELRSEKGELLEIKQMESLRLSENFPKV